MLVDCIILTNTVNLRFYEMTRAAIDSLVASEKNYRFSIKIVETNTRAAEEGYVYSDCSTIVPGEKFNYNRFLNHGLAHCESDWVIFANNDVIFMPGWFDVMMQHHKENPEIKSFSPCEPRYEKNITEKAEECPFYYGHDNREQIRGWCIVTHREIIKNCGLFDERFGFWYQDDDYGQTLKKAGYMHALMAKSHVQHIFGCSHSLLEDKIEEMTVGLKAVYEDKWNSLR